MLASFLYEKKCVSSAISVKAALLHVYSCESSWLLTIIFRMNLHHDSVLSHNDCVRAWLTCSCLLRCPVTTHLSSALRFLPLQTAGTYHMVALRYSFVLSTPSSTTVTTSAVTVRLSPCLSGRHTLSADRCFSLNYYWSSFNWIHNLKIYQIWLNCGCTI